MSLLLDFYYEILSLGLVLVVLLLLHLLYFRPPVGAVYVRTGWGGEAILERTGAFVIPLLHRLTPLDRQTRSLALVLEKTDALRTYDFLKVDMTLVASVRIALDAQSLRQSHFGLWQGHWQDVVLWWETGFRSDLAAKLATLSLEQVHQCREHLLEQLTPVVAAGFARFGVELVSLSLSRFEETAAEYYDTTNWMDAKGLALRERLRLNSNKQRYLQRLENELALRRSDFEASLQQMMWERDEFVARLQHIRFKAEADAKAEQALEEIQMAKDLALEMIQRDATLIRLQTEQEIHAARVVAVG